MKISEYWLREWVNHLLSTKELVNQLTMAGLEIDNITPVAPDFTQVIVGEVLSVASHPHAEKLTICQVNIGNTQPLTIVCGASNVQVGMRVPTALIGAQLPELKIEKAKIRGIVSDGMLCSAKELGLTEISSGLMSLPKDAPVGEEVRNYLQLNDVTIEIDFTPNRGDCLSINGIAREVSLLTRCLLNRPKTEAVAATINDLIPIELQYPQGCPRYVGRVIKQANVNAPTPLWMQERLRRCGLRSISAVVDVTNYILLELGQPLHAFDLAKLNGGIQVRLATAGEELTLLDGQTRCLDGQTLVIADHQQTVAIAGVMGGFDTAVTAQTQDIFLESAYFSPEALAGTARRYYLQTDASYRFERGVDFQLQRQAIERATALLLDLTGGQPGPVIEVTDRTTLPIIPSITLRNARIKRLLGHTIPLTEVSDILKRLGMTLTHENDTWQVTPPSYRFDLRVEADLIEEIARVYGYNQLPSRSPLSRLTMRPQPAVTLAQIQTTLVQREYQEVITYSFVDADLQVQLTPDQPAITLVNPIAKRQDNPTAIDLSVMRTTLWTGLIQTLRYNQSRQQNRLRLFETGLRFIQTANGIQQENMIAGIISGTRQAEQWGNGHTPIDFFDMKGDVEAVLRISHPVDENTFKADTHPALHPGQTAAIQQGEEILGYFGALHPSIIQRLALIPPIYLFEIRLSPLLKTYLPKFREVSKYPSIRRDIAIIVERNLNAAEVIKQIKATASELLTDLILFDVYQGDHLKSSEKSLAIGLIFQAFSRNLTEMEIDSEIGKILAVLEQRLRAHLRK